LRGERLIMVRIEVKETDEQKARSMAIIEAGPDMLKLYNRSSETGKQILRLFVLLDEATQDKALEMMRESGGTNE